MIEESRTTAVRRPIAEVPVVAKNLLESISAIEEKFADGHNPVILRGLSGTGKTLLVNELRKRSATQVELFDLAPSEDIALSQVQAAIRRGSNVVINQLGIPMKAPAGIPGDAVIHKPFTSKDLLRCSPIDASDPRYAKVVELARYLEERNLGSFTLLERLLKVHPSRGEEGIKREVLAFLAYAFFDSVHLENQDIGVLRSYLGDSPKARELLAELKESYPQILQDRWANPTVTDEHANQIEQAIFQGSRVKPVSYQTFRYYLEDVHAPRKEPSYILRSERPLSEQERVKFLEMLVPVLEITCAQDYLPELDSFGEIPRIDGKIGRKTGLYVVRKSEDRGSHSKHNLIELVELSEIHRVLSYVYNIGDRPLPEGIIVYGGGDHTPDISHVGAALAIEIILQELNVPYFVSRGKDIPERNFYFNGENCVPHGTWVRGES